jgi:hypothetical protein
MGKQLAFALSLSRSGTHAEAIAELMRYFGMGGADAAAYDALAQSALHSPDSLPGRVQGSITLALKDKAATVGRSALPLPEPGSLEGKQAIIAFTLFGSDPRYLRGALHNVLAARALYPGWTCRFYADRSADAALLDALRGEGAEIVMDEGEDQDFRHRLCRRFLVSDDAQVGRYLVRDCDSVVSAREAAAVRQWIESGLPFHVMRDWWTHTDPILAGLWGGVAGAFPNLMGKIRQFRSTAPETSNWDQWFLREQVWPAIRTHALVHDRLFASHGARPWPLPDPEDGSHVGQNEFAVDQAGQAAMLQPYAERVPALMLPKPVRLQFRTN